MKHLGDITKICGYDIEPVDVVTFGSPCQDLSVAGTRSGIAGARSGLIMDAIRIIKEMRKATNGRYPTFALWENVPGAFSSNEGEDFRAVLEELARIVDRNCTIPRSADGSWLTAGCVVGDDYSIAWRVLDAQYWRVPQRRRRIALVLDLAGQRAAQILFERESLRGDPAPGEAAGQGVAAHAQSGADCAIAMRQREGCDGGGKGPLIQWEMSGTLKTQNDQTVFCLQGNGIDRADIAGCNGATLVGDHQGSITDYTSLAIETYSFQSFGGYKSSDKASAIKSRDGKDATDLIVKKAVRRLIPLECERLQGFPDGWTDIPDYIDENGKRRTATDSARYRALGNSIAIPPFAFVLGRISEHLIRGATLGSLFDGIGGFPLIWEYIHGRGTARWASEIEQFPIAVTKYRFNTMEMRNET